MNRFSAFEQKMIQAGLSEAAIRAFEKSFQAVTSQQSGMISEKEIEPDSQITHLEDIAENNDKPCQENLTDLLAQTVVIKLNGGLGTSMGLQKAKTLLPVKDGATFLDLIVRHIQAVEKISSSKVRLLFMNSFSTSEDTIDFLSTNYKGSGLDNPCQSELMQNRVPKINAQTFLPENFPQDTDLEWCPPGHGDLFAALLGSGWLDRLLSEGTKYAFVSNGDNLGAVLDFGLLAWFASSQKPFVMEVTQRTAADKKGGHLARRKADGRLILREIAQCPQEDLSEFQNIKRHEFFNTNNLWINLEALKIALSEGGGSLSLPVIQNKKTIDPRNPKSTQVIQLETAMGAAIECFPEADAICVPRTRFAPVKTTADLFALKSDAYEVMEDGRVALAAKRNGNPPVIELDPSLHKFVDSLDQLGSPSLIDCEKLTVKGAIRFSPGVIIRGTCLFSNSCQELKTIPAGDYFNAELIF